MSTPITSPLEDSVPRINEEIAVGEDMVFQRRWWIFERTLWTFFALILIATLLGCFGRGYLAKASAHSQKQAIVAKYDQIQRTGTPSDITITLSEGAIHDGQARLFVSESLLSELGAQRVSPQPEKTLVNADGLTYVFPATQSSATVIISVEPSGPGRFPFTLKVPDSEESVHKTIYVVP